MRAERLQATLTLAHLLADEGGEVGGDLLHLVTQVLVQLFAVVGERDDARRKPLDVDQVERRDVHSCTTNTSAVTTTTIARNFYTRT